MRHIRFYGLLMVLSLCWILIPAEAAEIGEPGAVITQKEKGLVNWTQNYLEALGTGIAPTGMTGAQAKAMARRGAVVDLQRNLLEFMVGVQVDANTVVENCMADSTIRSEVHGIIKNVEVLDGEWDGETYTVKGRVRIGELRAAVVPNISPKVRQTPQPRSKTPQKARYTGLVIDVRHLPYIPAMSFQVYDQRGRAVYGMGFVDQGTYLQSGLCAYFTNINYARGESSVASNPLVVRAVKLGKSNVDIVISNADAAKIRNNSYDFRRDCKVIVVSR